MLHELSIKDFAIIDSLHLYLHPMLNVFTGETGAGKSIIIDAVNALLGGKIGAGFVRAGCERASIEGVFSVDMLMQGTNATDAPAGISASDTNFSSLLHEYDLLPDDGQIILSRDISESGRTVARINGRAVSLQILQHVGRWLIDIHGQSEHLSLLRPEQHINFLDRYAELMPLRKQLSEKVTVWRQVRKTWQALQQNEHDQSRHADFLRFEIDEIEKAGLSLAEEEELHQERTRLSNAERLHELCILAYGAIKGTDSDGDDLKSALDQLRIAAKILSELTGLDTTLTEDEEGLSEVIYRLEDLATNLSSYESTIEDDPQRLATIGERLDLIAKLKRKYGSTIEKILQRVSEDQAELEGIVNKDENIATLQQQDRQLQQVIGQLAQQLSVERYKAVEHLAAAMEVQLNELNMKRARFSVQIEQVPDTQGIPIKSIGEPEQYYACDSTGIDQVQFLIAPNPGEPFKPLIKIASGGETSRLMLALKTILTTADATPTLIFDEIDSGISGQSGYIVGQKLWTLSQQHQVICVTHLPQIAAFADTHYNVNKHILDGRTTTIVRELDHTQRISEIAQIMGGSITESSMKSAEEMLARSQQWKETQR